MVSEGRAATTSTQSNGTTALSACASQNGGAGGGDTWWESMSRGRKAIDSLAHVLSQISYQNNDELDAVAESLKDSENPSRALLDSEDVATMVLSALSRPSAGTATDPICQWLYDTYITMDGDLQLVVLRFVPSLAGIYMSRLVTHHSNWNTQFLHATEAREPLAGFEAVLLALYREEARARGGRPVIVHVPDLSQPSLYHTPRNPGSRTKGVASVGELCGSLEQQMTVKSTKRALIVSVALDLFCRKIASMPADAKIEMCQYVKAWAGQDCPCVYLLDHGGDDSSSRNCSSNLGSLTQEFAAVHITDSERIGNGGDSLRIGNGDDSGKFGIRSSEDSHGLEIENSGNGDSGYMNGALVERVGSGRSENSNLVNAEGDGERRDGGRGCIPDGGRIHLPWELVQPVLKILGHCLLAPLNPQEVRDAAGIATRCLFARASHELVPQMILATRSLVRLDIAAKQAQAASVAAAAAVSAVNSAGSNSGTPTKSRKPEILLVSK